MSAVDVNVVFELLRLQSTLDQVADLLRDKGVEHSASSWEQMIERRLKPSLRVKSITVDDLLLLLREVEEHGDQHVLLYQLGRNDSFEELFDASTLENTIADLSGWPQVGEPSFVNLPKSRKIVEVRRDMKGSHRSIIIKFVEQRIKRKEKGRGIDNGDFIIRYKQEPYRAVNVVRISEDGIADVRIFRHQEKMSYGSEAKALLQKVSPLVSLTKWEMLPLGKLRDNLLNPNKRSDIKKRFKLRYTVQKDGDGNRLQANSSGADTDILDAQNLIGSLDIFGNPTNATHCDRASIFVIPQKSNQREIGVALHGENHGDPNEFSVGAKLTRQEYEHVLKSILEFNS